MKKIYSLILFILITLYSFSLVVFNLVPQEENNNIRSSSINRNLQAIPDGSIPIDNFVDLARIGRGAPEIIIEDIEGETSVTIPAIEALPADGTFHLTQDIELPFIGWTRIEIADGKPSNEDFAENFPSGEELSMLQDLQRLIPEYFRSGTGIAITELLRGWESIPPFSGLFDGRNYTISGISGNRLSGNIANGGHRQVGGLFSVVTGTVSNLTVEVGQELHSPNPRTGNENCSKTGHLMNFNQRSSILHYTTRANVWNQLTGTPINTNVANNVPVSDTTVITYPLFNNNGISHAGGTGTIAGILYLGTIENSFSRSRSHSTDSGQPIIDGDGDIRRSHLQSREHGVGGIVGLVQGGTIRNTGSYVYIHGTNGDAPAPSFNAGMINTGTAQWTGGLAGIVRGSDELVEGEEERINVPSLVEFSYSKAVFLRVGNRGAGFISQVENGVTIRNSFSATRFVIHANNTSGDNNHIVSGFIQRIDGRHDNPVNIENVFTYTTSPEILIIAGSGSSQFDPFLGVHETDEEGNHTTTFRNNFAIGANPLATSLSMEQLQSQLIVDNFLNDIYRVFHLEEGNQFPTINTNWKNEVIERTTITASGTIDSIEGVNISRHLEERGELRLTRGEFHIEFIHNMETIGYELKVTDADILNNSLHIFRMTFNHAGIVGSHAIRFFRLTDNINDILLSVEIPTDAGGFSFAGWFDSAIGGQEVRELLNDDMEIWAQFTPFVVNITVPVGSEVIFYSIDDPNFQQIRIVASSGNHSFSGMTRGYVRLIVRMNGFIDRIEKFWIGDEEVVNKNIIFSDVVIIKGEAPLNSIITITNEMGVELFRNNPSNQSVSSFELFQFFDGVFFLTIERAGFITLTKRFEVDRQSIDFEVLTLESLEVSGTAREGTTVELFMNNQSIGKMIVGANGVFLFTNNPSSSDIFIIDGSQYEIVALLETFLPERQIFRISNNAVPPIAFRQSETEDRVVIRGITSRSTTVYLYLEGEVVLRTRSSENGSFEFIGVPNGTFTIVFERPNFDRREVENVVIDYTSFDAEFIILSRTPSDNSHIGIIIQAVIISGLLFGIFVVFYKRKRTKLS